MTKKENITEKEFFTNEGIVALDYLKKSVLQQLGVLVIQISIMLFLERQDEVDG